jgi:hypothetical protein
MQKEAAVVVKVDRWKRGLVLSINGAGVTQSHGWWDAELMVRDYLACFERDDADSVDICFLIDAAVVRPSKWRRGVLRFVPGLSRADRLGAGEITDSD